MVDLREVVGEAQRALEAGEHGVARAACLHILGTYPKFADIHRLFGEIQLEMGDMAGARQHFQTALEFDPQNVLATLGMGVIAEEELDVATAAACFQRALEIDPSLMQLRDELVRLYSQLFGQGGRLRTSSAGLAAIYSRGNQLSLAQRQYQLALEKAPDRIDLMLALAEVQWRAGDLPMAAFLCQNVASTQPEAVRALYLQADMFRRQGGTSRASELIASAAAIDPLGDVARQLEQVHPNCALVEMLPLADIPAFDSSKVVMAPPTPAYPPMTMPSVSTPIDLGSLAPPVTNSMLGVTNQPVEESDWQRIATELTASYANTIDETDATGGDEQAWPWDNAAPAADMGAPLAPAGDAASLEAMMVGWDQAAEEIAQATPGSAPVAAYADTLKEFESLGFKPFDVETVGGPEPNDIDLSSLDSVPSSFAISDPPAAIAPPAIAAPPSPPPMVAPAPASPLPPPAATPQEALAALVADWDSIDDELARATPSGPAADVQQMMAELGLETDVTPFSFDNEPKAGSLFGDTDWSEFDEPSPAPAAPPAASALAPLDLSDISVGPSSAPLPAFKLDEDDDLAAAEFDWSALDADTAAPAAHSTSAASDNGSAWDDIERQLASAAPTQQAGATGVADGWQDLDRAIAAATPATQRPRGFTRELEALDAEGFAPFDFSALEGDQEADDGTMPAAPPARSPQPAAGSSADDAWNQIDQTIAAATPAPQGPRGFTRELDALGAEGFVPFDFDSLETEGEAEVARPQPTAAPGPDDGWDAIDRTIAAATPAPQRPRGFTREIDALGAEGFAPFDFDGTETDDAEAAASASAPVSPPPAELSWQDIEANITGRSGPAGRHSREVPADLGRRATTPPARAEDETPPWMAPRGGSGQQPLTPAQELAAEVLGSQDTEAAWEGLEEEIVNATPKSTSLPSGFTDELRSLDELGLLPFQTEDGRPATGALHLRARTAAPPPPPPPQVSGHHDLLEQPATADLPDFESVLGLQPYADQSRERLTDSMRLYDEPVAPRERPITNRVSLASRQRTTDSLRAETGRVRRSGNLPGTGRFGGALSLVTSLFGDMTERKSQLVAAGNLKVRPFSDQAVTQRAPTTNAAVRQALDATDALPVDPVARRRLADTLAADGQAEEAAINYRLLLRSDPSQVHMLAQPVEDLAAAHPHVPHVMRLLGELYMRQGRYNQALSIYRALMLSGGHTP